MTALNKRFRCYATRAAGAPVKKIVASFDSLNEAAIYATSNAPPPDYEKLEFMDTKPVKTGDADRGAHKPGGTPVQKRFRVVKVRSETAGSFDTEAEAQAFLDDKPMTDDYQYWQVHDAGNPEL